MAHGKATAAGVALAVAVATFACGREQKPAAADVAPVPVTVARVSMAEAGDRFEAGGVVQARTTATVTSRILAPVSQMRVAPGDRVRAGQVLVVLDARDLAAQDRSARSAARAAEQGSLAAAADQQSAEAAATLARATHARISGLHAKRSATTQELDEATAALREAEARASAAAARSQQAASSLESARSAADAAAATATYATITAPFDGVVTEKMVEPGNMASPGVPLVRLEDTRAFRLEVRVDESRVSQIAQGAHVDVVVDSVRGDGAQAIPGTVAELGRAVDADARAFLVKIDLPGAAGLRSGLFGRARFAGSPRRVLTVPAGAVVRHGQVTSVFVVESGMARLRMVSLRDTEVLAGLSEHDEVVVAPPAELADGRRVTEGRR